MTNFNASQATCVDGAKATPGRGPLPPQFKTYSDWWIAERVRCSSCGKQLTTRWRERRRCIEMRLHHLRMIPRCLRFGKVRGALWHAHKAVT